jgi:flagellar motility protein MotE (MotC chaperone)/sporulation protein YlmC with PRC-barrel domain
MTSLTTFYFSRLLGCKVFDSNHKVIGKVIDLLVESATVPQSSPESSARPRVIGVKVKTGKTVQIFDFSYFDVNKEKRKITVICTEKIVLSLGDIVRGLFLADIILDKQIVDINGRKLVRVNDIRMVSVANGTFAIAVDVGIEGLLRRIGISRSLKNFLGLFNLNLPSKFILWDDVATIDMSNLNIKLSKTSSKLNTLHPSDLADIIEDLGKQSRASVFSSLDEETAADVLEELDTETQVNIVESLPVEKVADVFEKMPADEVADILDELEDDKAEMLLNEMEAESSQEVRELLEYDDKEVGSIMTTDFISFNENTTVAEVLTDIRSLKPAAEELYNLFVTDERAELVATVSLRDLVVSEPYVKVNEIMKESPIYLYDDQKIHDIAEIISKYNMLAIPVVDRTNVLQGMVVIDDVVEDLISDRRTNKK